MVQTSSHPSRTAERFTGPRRKRYKSLIEARKDAELPAGEFETVHPASTPAPRPVLVSNTRAER
ncbi:hypothetical protein SAMN05428969_0378 [Devosia sp. YR412]|uniref:hypothetical protein n=1 Tax=Devosia sp. YR412 TaxID=1881030 RepID=UPI0008BDE29F|nr:hypothetical protein [Devosia sp. YR412]SEP66758.1 hypothetical protein SAMN05428969_0378 [Devosia sp. YR412]